jgi:transposase
MDYIGIDLHKNSSQVCILTEDGELIERRIKRAHLAVRESLIRTRTKYISLIGALARREGCRIAAGSSPSFARRVEEAGLPAHTLAQIEPLLVMLKALNEQIKAADRRLEETAKADEVVQRRGKATAVVALARKLAGIMFAVWRDGTELDPQLLRPRGAPALT